MASSPIFEGQVEIPLCLRSLADFRRWAQSVDFPQTGRIDYVLGKIEVDMSPEDFFCHSKLKAEIFDVLYRRVKQSGLGHVVSDRFRVSCPEAEVSAEPDIVFVSHESLGEGRARLVPGSKNEPGRYVELEGPPDLIVEIVSDSSVDKDTRRLPEAYFKAGVREFWLADARKEPVVFQIHQPGDTGYLAVDPDTEGFQHSAVLGCSFRLDARHDAQGHWAFDLCQKQ